MLQHANKNNTSVPIQIRADETGAMAVRTISTVSASFTRPANTTGYSIGDVVSNSATTTVLMSFTCSNIFGGTIVKAIFKTDNPLWTGKTRLWLTNNSANVPVADNVAQAMVYTSSELGYIDFEAVATGTGCAFCGTVTQPLPFKPDASGKIYGWCEDRAGQTPISAQKFSFELTISN
jgi:hypothetical protein